MSTRKTVVGNTATDIDLKFSQTGKAWATFTVISNDGKDDSAVRCVTRCKVFGDLAENVASSIPKGTRVILSGREQTEDWETNGEKRSGNVLLVDAVGPDLRFASASVTRTQRVGSSPDASVPVSDPWATAPAESEPPF